jgi:hypothetical protein
MVSMADVRLYGLNAMTLSVTTFSNLEMSLKILLLLISIGYTISRWIKLADSKKEQENNNKKNNTNK